VSPIRTRAPLSDRHGNSLLNNDNSALLSGSSPDVDEPPFSWNNASHNSASHQFRQSTANNDCREHVPSSTTQAMYQKMNIDRYRSNGTLVKENFVKPQLTFGLGQAISSGGSTATTPGHAAWKDYSFENGIGQDNAVSRLDAHATSTLCAEGDRKITEQGKPSNFRNGMRSGVDNPDLLSQTVRHLDVNDTYYVSYGDSGNRGCDMNEQRQHYPGAHQAIPRFNDLSYELDRISISDSASRQSFSSNTHYTPQYQRTPSLGERGTATPLTSDYRRSLHSPYYSGNGTPPTAPDSRRSTSRGGMPAGTTQAHLAVLDRKLSHLERGQQDQYYPLMTMRGQAGYPVQYSYHFSGPQLRMNPLAPPYVMQGYPAPHDYPSSGLYQEQQAENVHIQRSPLLEEFRANFKANTNRYELKDIYNHFVEFIGDQHGSRFIQHKLQTANSDEKDQLFAETQENALQLMQDVFGNYVIQMMFDHGSQSQKKALAARMKGKVFNLSLSMYGCRVVQKALEHVLVEQQASMVKELDGQVMYVVKHQNGNHVIQKAIECVPGEHIQFIVDAHKGQVARLATHTYGCRVIQRMLEFCQEPARRSVLMELLECVGNLITDPFGNYVIQHVIANGSDDDRRRIVHVIQQSLPYFSKHKFGSNVVEKCIQNAAPEQRNEIIQALIGKLEHLDSNQIFSLMRDQYGNYVIRKSPASIPVSLANVTYRKDTWAASGPSAQQSSRRDQEAPLFAQGYQLQQAGHGHGEARA